MAPFKFPTVRGAIAPLAQIDTRVRPPLGLASEAAETTHAWVPLARDNAVTVLANQPRLEQLGLSREKIDALFGTTNAPAGTQPTSFGLATRYHDRASASKPGSVQGDGRAVEVAHVLATDASGRVTGISSLQQKGGVDTGLAPVGTVAGQDHHAGGGFCLYAALKDAVVSGYLETNGVNAERFVAVQRLSPWLGRYVREGQFVRLAHLNYLKDDPAALHGVLDSVNTQLSVELGRPTKMTLPGLFKNLVQRKARDLCELFWARMAHSSTTYDNIGLLSTLDLTVMDGQDRMHSALPDRQVSVGYANEPRVVLKKFTDEVAKFVGSVATGDERKVLTAMPLERFQNKVLAYEMTGQMLAHLGLDADDVAKTMKTRRNASLEAFKVLMNTGTQIEYDHTYQAGAAKRFEPSQYDAFNALKHLVEISTSKRSELDKQRELAKQLRPLMPDDERDLGQAELLLNYFRPVLQPLTAGLSGPARDAKLQMVVDQAHRINAPLEGLEHETAELLGKQMADLVGSGREAEANTMMLHAIRKNLRKGPSSAHEVAMALRHQRLTPDAEGWLTLSSQVEGPVRFEEQSNGGGDRIRVVLDGEHRQYRMNLGPSEHAWRLDVTPSSVGGGKTVFEVPLKPGEPVDSLRFGFVWGENQFLDAGGGTLFGQEWKPVLASKLLQAELASVAKANGAVREGTDPSMLAAVSGAPRQGPAIRSTPKVLAAVTTIDELYNLRLPPVKR